MNDQQTTEAREIVALTEAIRITLIRALGPASMAIFEHELASKRATLDLPSQKECIDHSK